MFHWSAKQARQSRKVTTALIEAAEGGIVSWEDIARNALGFMSEQDVAEMARSYDMVEAAGISDDEAEEEDND